MKSKSLAAFSVVSKILIFTLLSTSCSRSGDSVIEPSSAKIELELGGVSFSESDVNINTKNSSLSGANGESNEDLENLMILPITESLSAEVELLEEGKFSKSHKIGNKLAAAQAVKRPLGAGVRYKLVVYDQSGLYITERDYVRGNEAATAVLLLDGGKTYTFVCYSVNSTTILPNVGTNNLANAELSNVTGQLLYFKTTQSVVTGTNNLNVILKHQFSEVTVHMNIETQTTGSFELINNAQIQGVAESGNIKFSDNSLTYNNAGTINTPVDFGVLTAGLRTVVSKPVLLINSEVGASNGKSLVFGSIKIDATTKNNLAINNLKIKPGYKYNLNITYRTCMQDVTANQLMNWVYPNNGSNTGAMVGGVNTPNGTLLSNSFTAPNADYGFVFDFTEFDNAFNMEVNGVWIFGPPNTGNANQEQIQFQDYNNGAEQLYQNIEFIDGTAYQFNSIPDIWRINSATYSNGTKPAGHTVTPLLRVVVSRLGEITIFGKKQTWPTNADPWYQMRLKRGRDNMNSYLSFNTVVWNGTGTNNIRVTQRVANRTVLVGGGTGKAKIACP